MDNAQNGDPKGYRLAQFKLRVLADSSKLVLALKSTLQQAKYDCTLCDQLLKDLKAQITSLQQKLSNGRIESRRKKKFASSHPLQDGRELNYLYIDESGSSVPNSAQPFFALGAIAIDEVNKALYCEKADEIKLEFFGKTDITFHEPYMRRRTEIFWFGGDTKKQNEFDQAVDNLIEQTNFTVFGAGIRKLAFEEEFLQSGIDPYLPTNVYVVAIIMLMERYIDWLSNSTPKKLGRVFFESLGPKEDAQHQLEYARLLLEGTQWVSGGDFRQWLETGLRFQPKCHSNPGELADMFSRDLFEWISSGCTSKPKRWDIFSKKVYARDNNNNGKFGIKVFPAKGIEAEIQAHRHLYSFKN